MNLSVPVPSLYAVMELPPALLSGVWRSIYYATSHSYLCATPDNPFQVSTTINPAHCGVVTLPEYESSPAVQISPATLVSSKKWKINYDGVFSAHIIHDRNGNFDWILSVNHSETKNEVTGGYVYQNPFSKTPATSCSDGMGTYVNGVWSESTTYHACWEAYDGFVSTEWGLFSAAENYGRFEYRADRGPVIWPTDGYYDSNGAKASSGVRHPSSIIHDGYIYIFYLDTSLSWPNQLFSWGMKVARGELSRGGAPGSFYVWNGTDFSTPALPANFDKDRLQDFMSERQRPTSFLALRT
ncbi:MAG: hypothetical protein AB7G93_13970 [Bdellovibrionales bacterium]